MAIPKIMKNGKGLDYCRKGQIVKFPTAMAQVDVEEVAEKHGFRIWFYEPGDPEYNKHGRNVVRLQ